MRTVAEVRKFWEENPLWSGESPFEAGIREYCEEHRNVYIRDRFAGTFDERVMLSGPIAPEFSTSDVRRRSGRSSRRGVVCKELVRPPRRVCARSLGFSGQGHRLSAICAGMRAGDGERIPAVGDAEEIVRRSDGAENPIGKAYSLPQLGSMSPPASETFLHFSPRRTLPFSVPGGLHRLLD